MTDSGTTPLISGMTPLHKALLHGQTNAVRYLLAKYPSCVNAADHVGLRFNAFWQEYIK